MAIISQEESLFVLVFKTVLWYALIYYIDHSFCWQVAETLNAIFKSEGRTLDMSAIIELNANPFPYDLVFNWVSMYQTLF